MNDKYGMSGMAREYEASGKMPKKLVRYFERKNKEKEYAMGGAYREYQGSGFAPPAMASSSDYSDYRVFKEKGQPAQYFVMTDDGFSPAGTFSDLRAQLGDEGAANVISQFGLQPQFSDTGEYLSYRGTGEEFGRASDAFARELAGVRRARPERGHQTAQGYYDSGLEFSDDFLDFMYAENPDKMAQRASMKGMEGLPTDISMQRSLARDLMQRAEGEPLDYRAFARQVLGLGTGGAQGGR